MKGLKKRVDEIIQFDEIVNLFDFVFIAAMQRPFALVYLKN